MVSELSKKGNLITYNLERAIEQYDVIKILICEIIGLVDIFRKNKMAKIRLLVQIDGDTNVVVQFYPWFKFSFLLFLGMIMYDNEFRTKEKKI